MELVPPRPREPTTGAGPVSPVCQAAACETSGMRLAVAAVLAAAISTFSQVTAQVGSSLLG